MPLNVFDAHHDSFENEIVPICQEQGIAVIGMKSFASGRVFSSNSGITPQEALRYAMSLPVATIVSGMDSLKVLEQNLEIARNFTPLTDEERASIIARSKPFAANGEHERFKSTRDFEGNEGRIAHLVGIQSAAFHTPLPPSAGGFPLAYERWFTPLLFYSAIV